MQEAYAVGQTYIFTFANLVRSQAFNVRTKQERTSAKYQLGIEELAGLILAQGLLQNLIGFQQKKGSKYLNMVEIAGGGRRLDAIEWLIGQKKIDPAFPIEVRICTVEEALAKSLTENSGREPLPPADQFRAFKALSDLGQSCEEIATAYGVDDVTIKRRLKLANIAPPLFALYEEGGATLDQLMALALTDDHATQQSVWNSLGKHNRSHHQIRNLITTQEIDVRNNKVAKYVGIAAYEAAGGEVRRDLFSDNEGAGFMKDAPLLESVAVAKLESEAIPLLKNKTWAWVDYCTRMDYDELQKFGRVPMLRRNFAEKNQIKFDALKAQYDEIEAQLDALYERPTDGESEEQAAAIEEQINALNATQQPIQETMRKMEAKLPSYPDPAFVSVAGAVVTIDSDSTIVIHEGLVRPEDKKQIQKAQAVERAAERKEAGEEAEPEPTKSVHSEKLIRQLTAHRTAALQVLVSEQTNVALVILAHTLALDVFSFGSDYRRTSSTAQITLKNTHLSKEGEDVKQSPALAKFAESEAAWADRLPTKSDDLFAWLLEQEQSVVLELLAFCTAYSLTTVQSNETAQTATSQVIAAVNLDMADWWQPTRDSYFAQVSKQHIISIVSTEISPEIAKPMGDMKKIPLAEAAEQKMHDRRWLPPFLRAAA
jgi:ParB family chromosome partitioning protein